MALTMVILGSPAFSDLEIRDFPPLGHPRFGFLIFWWDCTLAAHRRQWGKTTEIKKIFICIKVRNFFLATLINSDSYRDIGNEFQSLLIGYR